MQEQLDTLLGDAKTSIQSSENLKQIEQLRIEYLGKKGKLTDMLKNVSQLPTADRPTLGKAINLAKRELQSLLETQEHVLNAKALMQKIAAEKIDITLPGRGEELGHLHPVARVQERILNLFSAMGFSIEQGPEIEDEEHNFTALNIPEHHPARAMQDTFYFPDGRLLRTHTSTVQIRVMKNKQPPLRIVAPGRVYRRDSDATHTPMFHQIEGLVIDKKCTFSDLKGLLKDFLTRFFEVDVRLRFRPGYFPFTEPSAEVDIERVHREGDKILSRDWLEVLGCGMVHPNVLRNVGIDPEEYTGFAFGIGMDRLAMLRYGVNDLRQFFENDLRFLKQF